MNSASIMTGAIASQSRFERGSRFGMVAFGVIGLIYGILQVAPWVSVDRALMTTPMACVLWSLPYCAASAVFGRRYGGRFVELASSSQFARAAGIVITCLFVSGTVFSMLYCAALVAIGDFGSTGGVFGSFVPETLFQKFMGTLVLFLSLVLRHGVSSIVGGFISGYFTALFFDREWRDE